MHALEKILAQAAGKTSVTTGEVVDCRIDLAGVNDLYPQTIRSFLEMGGESVCNPDGTVFFLDHYSPASTIRQAETQARMRDFCRKQGIVQLFDVGEGVCHQVIAENGLVGPGMLIVVTDSHATTHGAFGAFGTGVGATDLAAVLVTGRLWFRVPEIVRLNLKGSLANGVMAKDVALKIIGDLGADYGVYKAIEFSGPLIDSLSMSERMTLCNMTTEIGAKTSYIRPDAVTSSFLRDRRVERPGLPHTDEGYRYVAEHEYDLASLRPQLAVPHSVDNVVDLEAHVGVPVQQAFLGTCTGGKFEDLEIAARILEGRRVSRDTRLLVVPASRQVLVKTIDTGIMRKLIESGATCVTPGCAACLGTHQGILAAGEVCISSSSRNFLGRMGDPRAQIYLGSPAAVAASAVEGQIADPTKYLD